MGWGRWLGALAVVRAEAAPLYFYEHVPKTGGVSFSSDLVGQFGLVSCFGRDVRKAYPNVTWAMAHGKCDYGNTEGKYGRSLVKFPSVPRVLVLLRDPAAHVVSQYSHCQLESDIKKWHHARESFDDWVEAWFDAAHGPSEQARADAFDRAKKICHYQPINMQTRKLCDAYDRDTVAGPAKHPLDVDACLARALDVVTRTAWHVGHLEAYDAGLCALGLRINGKQHKHCRCARPESSFGHKADHHTASSSNRPSDPATLARVANLTAGDRALWRAAVARFDRDVEDLGARCRH